MKTFKDLKDEIARINNIDMKGFDGDWVLRKFARDQALINIELIKPYTDRFSTVVMFLVTGKEAATTYAIAADAVAAAADDAADDAATYAATSASAATYATYAAAADADAATYAAYAAADAATYATYATVADADYTKSIEGLNTLANEYLALLACAE